jgi:hypothetical protein
MSHKKVQDGSCGNGVCVEKTPQVFESLDCLTQSINECERLNDILISKCSSIMVPNIPGKETDENEKVITGRLLAPLAQLIMNINNRIVGIIESQSDMLDRIEL